MSHFYNKNHKPLIKSCSHLPHSQSTCPNHPARKKKATSRPRGCCCPGSLPYVGGFLTLLALVLTIASLAVPWYYLGGTQLVLGSSGLHWGVAASLNSLTYCSFFLPLMRSTRECDVVKFF